VLGVGVGGPAGPAQGPAVTPPLSETERNGIAVLLSVSGLGPLTLARLVAAIGSPSRVLELALTGGGRGALVAASRDPEGAWHAMPGVVADAIVTAAGRADAILREIRRLGLEVVAETDAAYPRRLHMIQLPPPALFVRGDLRPLEAQHVVAIVGTRRATNAGRRHASRIAAALSRAGATVVSGLAVGIDGAAHAATLSEGGRTVAFIGGGHGRLFPRAHDRLADAIVDGGGAVISEYAPRIEPSKGTFPQRNRLISGAADAVVVVEAGARSGALVTASWALEQGRECFIVPGPIDAPASAGCNGFLRDWPELTRIVAGVPQLLEDLGLTATAALLPEPGSGSSEPTWDPATVRATSSESLLLEASPSERLIGELLIRGAVTVDELVALTGFTVAAVLASLTGLETRGFVDATRGRYRPAGRLAAALPKPGTAAA
jgi:DNA processing protein